MFTFFLEFSVEDLVLTNLSTNVESRKNVVYVIYYFIFLNIKQPSFLFSFWKTMKSNQEKYVSNFIYILLEIFALEHMLQIAIMLHLNEYMCTYVNMHYIYVCIYTYMYTSEYIFLFKKYTF